MGNDRKIITTLAKSTNFEGDMDFSSSVKIKGKYTGKLNSTGFLYIDDTAVVNADICVSSLVIAGTVNGDILVKDSLEILSTAKIKGNIKTVKLKIEDGVEIDGWCDMVDSLDDLDIFSGSTDKVKKTLNER